MGKGSKKKHKKTLNTDKPAGEEIFFMANDRLGAKYAMTDELVEERRWQLIKGTCAAMTAIWIRKTYQSAGDLDFLKVRKFEVEVAQAAYIRWGGDKERLFAAQGLQIVSVTEDIVFTPIKLRTSLESTVETPGTYYFGLNFSDGFGHAVGAKTGGPNLDQYWFFDCNVGLYRTRSSGKFAKQNSGFVDSFYGWHEPYTFDLYQLAPE